jgi:DNA polymerase III alpha subunit
MVFTRAVIVPLHVKSHHSWCAGTASPEQLVARAAQHKCAALALTDIDNLHGQPRFQELCRAADIAPILGVELRAASTTGAGRLVLLAKHAQGYANLCRIVSTRHGGVGSEGARHAARDPVQALAGHTRGLFVMTDDPHTLARLLARGISRADLRLLLVRPSQRDERPLHEAAARMGVPLVADAEIAMLDPDDCTFHALLIAALTNRPITATRDAAMDRADRWFRAPGQQLALFADVPRAIEETARIAEQCQFRLVRERPIVPGAEAFGGTDPERVLTERCQHALAEVQAEGRCTDPTYAARLARELEVIDELGYAGYFRAAAELASAAARREIAIAVRGSAASSLVVHLLGISAIDPLAHGLHFERCLHARRTRPPDIDLDVCSERREQLLRWVFRRFGRERVALVGTLPTFQLDSALRSGLAALGASPSVRERFLAAVARFGAAAENDPKQVPEAALTSLPTHLREALPLIARLIGKPRSLAMHPGGIVIAPRAITDHVPVELGRSGLLVAQYDRRSIEQTGLTKLDLLGNRFLAQLQRARALSHDAPRLHECPLDDTPTLARLDRADTLGCFQVETPLLRSLLVQLPIRRLDDCVAALALARPGAAAGAAKRDWLRFVDGVGHTRPPLYDEDLLDMLSASAGISLAAADQLRTRIIDCLDPRELDELQRAYVQQAADNHRDPTRARATWQQARRFAAYSFCKAHAWSYALLAYQSVYFKTHHLLEFGCALLDNYGGAYPLRTIAADLQRSGASIAGPSVNASALASTLAGRTILLGLARIKHLRNNTATAIIAVRQERGDFHTIEQLTQHVRLSQQELRALILCGACDRLSGLSAESYPFAHEALLRGSARPEQPLATADPLRLAQYRALVRAHNELELLDMHVTDHPLRILRAEARRHGCISAAEIQDLDPGARIRFAGLLAASRRHRARNGGVIEYLTFEDESGLLDAFIPMPAHARLGPVVTTPGPYLAEGRILDDHGHRQIELGSLRPFFERHRSPTQG